MHTTISDFGALLGRIMLGAIFVWAGYHKITGFEQTAVSIAAKGLPYSEVLTVLAIIAEFGGGILLIIGWNTRLAALAILIFTLVTSYFFHQFWLPDADTSAFISFSKNIAISGGLIYVMSFGAGRLSLDRK